MKRLTKLLGSLVLSGALLVGCSETNNGKTDPAPTTEKETLNFDETIKLGEQKLKEGEYGSAKKYFLEAYENKEGKDDYRAYADLYLAYTLLNKKTSAKSVHREVMDDLSEADQKAYLEYMEKVIQDNKLDIKVPAISQEDSKEEKQDKKLDKKAPEFTMFSSEIYADLNEHFDYNDFFKAQDDSKFTIEFDDSKVNYGKEGKYKITVTVEDEYGNKDTQTASVIVVDNTFKYGPALYKSSYGMNIRTSPSTSASIVAEIPATAPVIIEQIYRGEDGSYWGILSTGYVCIENANGVFMNYVSAIPVNARQYANFSDFEMACGFNNVPFGFTVVPKGINYTAICEGPAVY